MQVNVVKIGTPLKTVELNAGATVADALREAGYSVDSVNSIKVDWVVKQVDSALQDGNTILVSMEKIKGGSEEDDVEDVILVGFELEYRSPETQAQRIAYSTEQSTFEIVKSYLHSTGNSMDSFLWIEDSEGNAVSLSDALETDKDYKILLSE